MHYTECCSLASISSILLKCSLIRVYSGEREEGASLVFLAEDRRDVFGVVVVFVEEVVLRVNFAVFIEGESDGSISSGIRSKSSGSVFSVLKSGSSLGMVGLMVGGRRLRMALMILFASSLVIIVTSLSLPLFEVGASSSHVP